MSDAFSQTIQTKIWHEEPEPENPFAATSCRCYGYDVYGDILNKASYIEYLFLLFKGNRPTHAQAAALNRLAIALANPGPRDASVHAAMAVCVSGVPAANTLIAALSVGAGSYTGAREVFLAVKRWQECGTDLKLWQSRIQNPPNPTRTTIWPDNEHPPGFDPYGKSCPIPTLQTLQKILDVFPGENLSWLAAQQPILEATAGIPLNILSIAATTLFDLEFSAEESEMIVLLLRLPGAAVHALEQKKLGFRQFPFFSVALEHDPMALNIQEIM